MINSNLSSLAFRLLIVALFQSVCHGTLERTASDYLEPLFEANEVNSSAIDTHARWLAKMVERYSIDEDPRNALDLLGRIGSQLSQQVFRQDTYSPLSSTRLQPYELMGLANMNIRTTSNLVKDITGLNEDLIVIINHLIHLGEDVFFDGPNICDTRYKLTFIRVFLSLYELPDGHAVTISESGMRFGPSSESQPSSKFYRLLMHLITKNLSYCLYSIKFTFRTEAERDLDLFLTKLNDIKNPTDHLLWQAGFKLFDQVSTISSNEAFLKSGLSELPDYSGSVTKFLQITCEKLRVELDSSAGTVTLSMGFAPEMLSEVKKLNFLLSKRLEYFRICNRIHNAKNQSDKDSLSVDS